MTTLAILQLILAAAGPILGAWAHYRLNRAATPPPAPQIGDGHILAALLAVLNGTSPAKPPPPPPTPPADLAAQLVALLGQAQAHLAQLAQQPPPRTGGTAP
jgi:hypothetical protein